MHAGCVRGRFKINSTFTFLEILNVKHRQHNGKRKQFSANTGNRVNWGFIEALPQEINKYVILTRPK